MRLDERDPDPLAIGIPRPSCKVKFCLFWLVLLQTVIGHSDFGFVFLEWPSWEVVAPGQELVLHCSTNLASDVIEWHHNHRPIDFSPDVRPSGDYDLLRYINVTSLGSEGSRLILKVAENRNVYKQQEGLYQCVASVGSISVTSLPGRVEVAFISDFVPESQDMSSPVRATEGEPFRISCRRPESVPEAKMLYYKNGELIDMSKVSDYYETLSGDLIVIQASATSKGVYSCAAYNEILQKAIHSGHSTTIHVDRRSQNVSPSRPFILNFQPLYTVAQGEKVRMLCLVFGDPKARIWWSVDENSSPPSYILSEDASSLVISKVSSKDEGRYGCHANNTQGQTSSDILLSVQEAPYLVEGAESKTVSEGDSAILSCVFRGRPMPTVAWVFNGNLLTSSRNLLLSGNHLDISSASKSQAGVYQCFAFNPLGAAEGTAVLAVVPKTITAAPELEEGINVSSSHTADSHLKENSDLGKSSFRKRKHKKVKKKLTKKENESSKQNNKFIKRNFLLPSKPYIAKLTDHSVMVTWNISSPRQAIPIVFFKVQYRALSSDKEKLGKRWKTVDDDILPHVRSFEIMDLDTENVYRFRVAAIYSNDDSKFGPSSKRFFLKKDVQLRPPDSHPVLLNITRERDTSVLLQWSYRNATSFTEGFIIYYRDTTSAADYTKITLLGNERRYYIVSHLMPNNSYDFKMCSFNMAGSSEFSPRFAFMPYGMNFSLLEDKEERGASTMVVPVVQSNPEGLTSYHLYIALGVGLSALLVIVVASFLVYTYKNKHAEDSPSVDKEQDKKEAELHSADEGLELKPFHVCRLDDPTNTTCHCANIESSDDPPLHPSQLPLLGSNCHSPTIRKQDEQYVTVPLCTLSNGNNNNINAGLTIQAREIENNEELDTR